MAYNQIGGNVNLAPTATDQLSKILTLAAGNVLTHFVCEGVTLFQTQSASWSTASTFTDAVVGGLQYGAAGYGGQHLSGGTTGGFPWVTFGNLARATSKEFFVPGLAPQNAILGGTLPISVDVRTTLLMPSSQDFYICTGTFPSNTYNIGLQVSWWAEWAS